MYRYVQTTFTLGAVVLLVIVGTTLLGQGEVMAEPLDFDFTYTSEETVKVTAAWDTVRFESLLTNTGTEADSYLVTLTENDPTPEEWWVRLCAGGCLDSTVTEADMYLDPAQFDFILLDLIPRTVDSSNITITVESRGNPGAKLTKSITFILTANYLPGDVNGDQIVDLGDVLFLISYLYKGGTAPDPTASGDPNADCLADLGDVLYLISYLYKDGPAPQPGCA